MMLNWNVWPDGRLPIAHSRVEPPPEVQPLPFVVETNVVPAGRTSLTRMLFAWLGPLFVTVSR
jgi:hypothetical protein